MLDSSEKVKLLNLDRLYDGFKAIGQVENKSLSLKWESYNYFFCFCN